MPTAESRAISLSSELGRAGQIVVLALLLFILTLTKCQAAGDAEKGKKEFRKCRACHAITAPDGTTVFRGGKVGPNLFGVLGRQAGTLEGFKFGTSIVEAGEKGLVWNEEYLVDYIKDPPRFLANYLDIRKARSKMAYKLPRGAPDIVAYLQEVASQHE